MPTLKGTKFTEEHKRKIAAALTGRKRSEETKRKIGLGNRGKHISKETRARLSLALSGSRHPNWKGGITPLRKKLYFSDEYRQWRLSVFTRDNFTCTWCGETARRLLQADHIKPWAFYPALRFVLANGRTLCFPCHKTTDTWGRRPANPSF